MGLFIENMRNELIGTKLVKSEVFESLINKYAPASLVMGVEDVQRRSGELLSCKHEAETKV